MGISVFRDSVNGRQLVGRIEYDRSDFATFAYDAHYVTKARLNGEIGISERLPLTTQPYSANECAPFLQGLLPEGDILDNLSVAYQVPRSDFLSFIDSLGCECIGALTFLSDSSSENDIVARYEALASTVIERAKQNPVRLAIETAIETRLSLSGAQSKVAWYLPAEKAPENSLTTDWYVPKGTAPSSHIIKMSRQGEEHLAYNELACSLLSKACGFETAKVSLVPEIPGTIAIERYDRKWIEDASGCQHLLRLHQEDFCQALGLAPRFKYQPDGITAEYIIAISDLLRDTTANPIQATREFAKRLVFDYAIGNTDAHLKNSSLLYDITWKQRCLAPMYDITCIPLSGYSIKMPFDVGKHRMLDEIDGNDILAIALDVDVLIGDFVNDVQDVVRVFENPQISEADNGGKETVSMIGKIIDNAKPRIDVLRSFLQG